MVETGQSSSVTMRVKEAIHQHDGPTCRVTSDHAASHPSGPHMRI
jgi:hypothetical protein